MIKKVDILGGHGHVFGNPAPMGLLGLAIASFSLVPITFGIGLTEEGFRTVAIYCLLFGAGCQLLTGLMDFANKNAFGGAIFTTFAFMWMKNAWEFDALSKQIVPDHNITVTVEFLLFFVFLILTYGFGFFTRNLFLFLVTIDLIYVCKIINFFTHSQIMMKPIGIFTALMGIMALQIAFASLINPVAGVEIFKDGPPIFKSKKKKALFDFSLRYNIFEILYYQWKENAFKPMPLEELETKMKEKIGEQNIIPDLFYLMDYGCAVLTFSDEEKSKIKEVRLNSAGIDLYEQLVLKKYEF